MTLNNGMDYMFANDFVMIVNHCAFYYRLTRFYDKNPLCYMLLVSRIR